MHAHAPKAQAKPSARPARQSPSARETRAAGAARGQGASKAKQAPLSRLEQGSLRPPTPTPQGRGRAGGGAGRAGGGDETTPADAPATATPADPMQAAPAAPVAMTALSVNHPRVTVPPAAGLAFSASKTPANAPGVTFALVGDNATIASGTTINATSGVITVDAAQTGGSAHVEANQTTSAFATTSPFTAPFNFTATPGAISSTSSSTTSASGMYGGEFTHTFTSPAGGQTALERAHVNEHFPAASGNTLTLNGLGTTFTIALNSPNSASAGWDLDATGTMVAEDNVTWSDTVDARPFVVNASNRTPANPLPQAVTATQNFRNLVFPANTYAAATVASTTHRRAFEMRNNSVKAVTSAGTGEVEQDYVGPTVFHHAAASPTSIPVVGPTPPGGTAPTPTTSTISVTTEGQSATPTFSFSGPDLGCTLSTTGELTPGTTAGTVTVRVGTATHYDEASVTLTPAPPPPAPTPAPGTPPAAP